MSQISLELTLESGRFYTNDECCELLKISPGSLVRLRRESGFPTRNISGGPRTLGADIIEWFRNQKDTEYIPRPAMRKLKN